MPVVVVLLVLPVPMPLELVPELGLLELLELEPLMPLGVVSDVLGGAPVVMLDEPVVDDVLPDVSVELVLLLGEELMLPVPGALGLPLVEDVDVSLVVGDVIVVDDVEGVVVVDVDGVVVVDVDGVVVVVVDGVVVVVVVVVEPDERPYVTSSCRLQAVVRTTEPSIADRSDSERIDCLCFMTPPALGASIAWSSASRRWGYPTACEPLGRSRSPVCHPCAKKTD